MSETTGRTFRTNLERFGRAARSRLHQIRQGIRRHWRKSLRKFTKWVDPKLEPYRSSAHQHLPAPAETHASSSDPQPARDSLLDSPRTREDIMTIISSAPFGIFSKRERNMIINLLDLPEHHVSELMLPKSKIVYVADEEIIGPLTLDRLYRSGLSFFPVVDHQDQVLGILHTAQLNSLEIRDSQRADQAMDRRLYYARDDYTLEQALDTFLRTNSQVLLVVDSYGRLVGLLSFHDFCQAIFGQGNPSKFDRDNDRLAVAKRRD